MAGIQLERTGLGLDTETIVDPAALDRAPAAHPPRPCSRRPRRPARTRSSRSSTKLRSLKTAAEGLTSVATWAPTQTASTSDAAKASARVTGGAGPGAYTSRSRRSPPPTSGRTPTRPTAPTRTFTLNGHVADDRPERAARRRRSSRRSTTTPTFGVYARQVQRQARPGLAHDGHRGHDHHVRRRRQHAAGGHRAAQARRQRRVHHQRRRLHVVVEHDLQHQRRDRLHLRRRAQPQGRPAASPSRSAAAGDRQGRRRDEGQGVRRRLQRGVDLMQAKHDREARRQRGHERRRQEGRPVRRRHRAQRHGELRFAVIDPPATGNSTTHDELAEIGISTGDADERHDQPGHGRRASSRSTRPSFNAAFDANPQEVQRLVGAHDRHRRASPQALTGRLKPYTDAGRRLRRAHHRRAEPDLAPRRLAQADGRAPRAQGGVAAQAVHRARDRARAAATRRARRWPRASPRSPRRTTR